MAQIKRNIDTSIIALVYKGKEGEEELFAQYDEVRYGVGMIPPVGHIRQEVWDHVKERAETEWGDRLVTLMWESDMNMLGYKSPRADEKFWDPESEEEPEGEKDEGYESTPRKRRARRALEELMGDKK